jgi:dienelactone hydrolase
MTTDQENFIAQCRMRVCGAAVLTGILLAGCSHAPPKPDETKVSSFSVHGYTPDEHYSVVTTPLAWTAGADRFDLLLTMPDKGSRFPLVIYLPGLGETPDAGNNWRDAWTKAGYAVISLQPIGEDEKSWSDPKARTGDFVTQARERYAPNNVVARIDRLQLVWRELARRQAAGEAGLARIDLSRVAAAGFDLGAYTAMTLAGESLRGAPKPVNSIPLRAVIALSPYADYAGSSFADRYRTISLPVLSVTTDSDADALGVVTAPSVRKAPFEYMPPGDKYLMLVWGVPHFIIGGNDLSRIPEDYKPDVTGPTPLSHNQAPHPPGKLLPMVGESAETKTALTVQTVTANAIGITAIAGVSTAFLDAYVKNDPVALEWLDKDAVRWLKDQGEFKKK